MLFILMKGEFNTHTTKKNIHLIFRKLKLTFLGQILKLIISLFMDLNFNTATQCPQDSHM